MSDRSNRKFAETGLSQADLSAEMEAFRSADRPWNEPKNLRASYDAGDDVVAVANAAYAAHIGDNAIYSATSYPSLRRYEDGVVAMVCEMLNAPEGAVGSVTTGGTESITMAVKTARDWARAAKPEIREPELVLPRTAHPAFNKAAELLGLKPVRMEKSADHRADLDAMTRAIGPNTIMIVGSAPPFPYGLVDPIARLGALAERHGLWLHVDACVGGFVLPFARELGHPVPAFDFEVPAVSSMSVDLHKYGFSGRGASVLVIRDEARARHQGFNFDAWPAGIYRTANIAGSRNGGAVASAYAVMRYLGRAGYRNGVARMLETKRRIAEGLERIGGLRVLGQPEGTHFSIVADALDIFAIGDGMAERGWLFSRGVDPNSLQLLLNPRHGAIVDQFLADMAEIADLVRAGKIKSRGVGPVYIV